MLYTVAVQLRSRLLINFLRATTLRCPGFAILIRSAALYSGASLECVVGITLAIVPPLGLILSIIGLTKSKVLAGAGKTLSITGIVVSLLGGTGIVTLVAIAGPAPPDPGCITAQVVPSQMMNTISADEAAMSRDQNNPLAMRADARHLMIDVQPLETRFTTAQAQAQHQSVKAALSALASDLKTTTSVRWP